MLPQRGDSRAEADGADERVQHEIRAGLDHELHQPLGAAQHLPVGPRLRGSRRGVLVAEGDPGDAVRARLLDQRLPGASRREPHDLKLLAAGADV